MQGLCVARRKRQSAGDRRRSRRVLLWAVLGFVALQAGLVWLVERWMPSLRDPQYGSRLALLRHRLAAAPGRPLVLFMGTSRTLNGVRPSLLPAGSVVSFNFGQCASGPLRQVLILRRLLRAGIRPAHIYLEVLPAQLPGVGEADLLLSQRWPGLGDWGTFRRYWPTACSRGRWWGKNLLPCVSLRDRLVCCLLPWARPSWSRPGRGDGSEADNDGFFGFDETVTGAALARWRAKVRASAAVPLARFTIRAGPNRALHHFLSLCRRRRIPVSLLLLPEGSECRSWYPPFALARLNDYLDSVRREYGVEVVDARRWVGDEGFSDSVHLLPRGADVFTRRFGREVYQPLLRRWHVECEDP